MSDTNSDGNLNPYKSLPLEGWGQDLSINNQIGIDQEVEEEEIEEDDNLQEKIANIRQLGAREERVKFLRLLSFYDTAPYYGLIRKSYKELQKWQYVFEHALDLYLPHEQVEICCKVSKIYCYSHVNNWALDWLNKAEEIIKALKSQQLVRDFVLRVLHMKADILCRLGSPSASHNYLKKARRHWRTYFSHDKEAKSWYYINLGNIYLYRLNFHRAATYYTKALWIRERMKKSHLLAMNYCHLTELYVKSAKAEKNRDRRNELLRAAKMFAKKAISSSDETNEGFYIGDLARWHYAGTKEIGGKVTEAIRLKGKALKGLVEKLPMTNSLSPKLQQELDRLTKKHNM